MSDEMSEVSKVCKVSEAGEERKDSGCRGGE